MFNNVRQLPSPVQRVFVVNDPKETVARESYPERHIFSFTSNPQNFSNNQPKYYQKLVVTDVFIPTSNYYLADKNVIIIEDNVPNTYTITIDANRWYTGSELAAVLATDIGTAISDACTCTYSSLTGKLTFSTATVPIRLIYAGSSMAPVIGLSASFPAVAQTTAFSPQNTVKTRSSFYSICSCVFSNLAGDTYRNFARHREFIRVANQSPDNSTILYQPKLNEILNVKDNVNFSNIDLSILDDQDSVVDFNGQKPYIVFTCDGK